MRGKVYKSDRYCGDSLGIMKTIDNSSVDLILTDLSYNLGLFMSNSQTNLGKMRENFLGSSG